MWPTCRSDRARLAAHLVFDSAHPVMEMVETLVHGWTMSVSNGIVHVAGGVSFEAALAGPVPTMVPPTATPALALHMLWLTFAPAVLATFVQSKHMSTPTTPFWATLNSWIAWIIAAPVPITAALHVGRPDLQDLAGQLYTEWLCLCRSPQVINDQLIYLLGECWDYTTHSCEWAAVQQWIERAGIMCTPPGPGRKATISLNGAPCLVLSIRDRVLLVLVQLFCTPFEWSRCAPPDSAPAAFRALHTTLTSVLHRPSPIDELYPREQYEARTFL